MIRRRRALALSAALLFAAAPLRAQTPEETAAAALAAAPVWDGHNDTPIQLRLRFGNVIGSFDFRDTTGTGDSEEDGHAMQTDLARLRAGKVGAQFWSVFVPGTVKGADAVQAMLEQIDVIRRLVARYPADLQLATSASEVEAAIGRGQVASLMGIEGGDGIGESLGVLRQMHALGVRYMTLTHTKTTNWADSATDAPRHGGLTDFGRDVVREMNRLGMLVDLSHAGEATMLDTLDMAAAPLIFSHSGARAVNDHPRNVPDRVLDRLKANGGIVMVMALPAYVSAARYQWGARREGEKARLKILFPGDEAAARDGLAEWRRANPEPAATVAEMADHIEHIARRIGVEHVGIGGDYDGMVGGPESMTDVSGYPVLFAELARRGFTQAELELIASRNMMRVLRAAEDHARGRQADPPAERPVSDWGLGKRRRDLPDGR